MEKLTVVSGFLFFIADIFAIASLANPEWIITDVAGNMRLGLTRQCQVIYGRPEICIFPRLSIEWMITFVFIVCGIFCLTVTCLLLVLSYWRQKASKYARWVAFSGMTLFCLAAIVFPIGFHIDEIGGKPYKLPNHIQVGSSYVLFILSIFFTIISELFAAKELSGVLYFLIGAAAKTAATIVTYPLQVLQSRLRAGYSKIDRSKGLVQMLLDLVRSQGMQVLYKGMEAKLLQTVVTAAMMFLTYEKIAAFIFHLMGQEYSKSKTI
ncbi:hypothetical protein ScPMuIL_004425 [Solemya velum]